MTAPPPTIDRRRFLAALGALGTGAGLAACGGSGTRASVGPGASAGSTSTASAAGSDGFRSRPDLRPPAIRVVTAPRRRSDDHVFTDVHAGTGQQGALILDRRGQVAYFEPVSDHGGNGRRIFNVRVQRYRGEPVMTYWLGAMVSGHGQGNYHLYDQSYRQVAVVRAGNGYSGDLHEFRLTSRGTALLSAYGTGHTEIATPRAIDGPQEGPYFYGVAQEVDIATGRVLLQWRSNDHVPLAASYENPPDQVSNSWDYFHINTIEVDPDDGNLIISGRNTWAFYKVDRDSGRVIWTCGGRDSDFHMGAGTTFRFQHHVVPHGGGLFTIFDNQGGPPQEVAQSRALVLHVSQRRRRVRFVREIHHRPRVYSSSLGSVQKMRNGGYFVGWGVSTWFTEYDRRGRVLVDARLEPVGLNSYRAFQQRWQGRPYWPPRIAVQRSGAHATVYVSWNGATVHRAWQLLGGERRDRLAPLGVHEVHGFETAITVDRAPPWLAVRALDERGAELATSQAQSG
ncbi:MAG TPA: arylsulfotransferase family protein [Solirubrobacteraceae bacterium]|nr:arylsulfotransferase family protein [Solirubrobacteraceae bacterium]